MNDQTPVDTPRPPAAFVVDFVEQTLGNDPPSVHELLAANIVDGHHGQETISTVLRAAASQLDDDDRRMAITLLGQAARASSRRRQGVIVVAAAALTRRPIPPLPAEDLLNGLAALVLVAAQVAGAQQPDGTIHATWRGPFVARLRAVSGQ